MLSEEQKALFKQYDDAVADLTSVGKHRGVAIRILDIIEEMLENKVIMIPVEDRTGDESEACLYGMTYADLENAIEELPGRYYPSREK